MMSAANSWEVDDASLIEIASLPFSDLLQRAHQHDVLALNHLYRTYTRSLLHKKAARACARLAHMGDKCLESETSFEHAFDASVQYGIEKVFGFVPDNKNELLNVALRGQFSVSDITGFKDARESALKKLATQVNDDDQAVDSSLVSTWGHLVHTVTKRGFVDESRRRWNSARLLAQRIDQRNYFVKAKQQADNDPKVEYTTLFTRFVETWQQHISKLKSTNTSHAKRLLEVLAQMQIDLTTPEGLLLYLRVLYFDACENTYVDNYPIDELRIRRSFVTFKIFEQETMQKIDLSTLTSLAVLVEECLRLSYSTQEISDQAILHHLQKAREATRIFEALERRLEDESFIFDYEDELDEFLDFDDEDVELEE